MNFVFVYIKAPSADILRSRLEAKGGYTKEDIDKRVAVYEEDCKQLVQLDMFDKILNNDDQETFLAQGMEFVEKQYCSTLFKG